MNVKPRKRAAPHERTVMKTIATVIEPSHVWSWGGGSAHETSTGL